MRLRRQYPNTSSPRIGQVALHILLIAQRHTKPGGRWSTKGSLKAAPNKGQLTLLELSRRDIGKGARLPRHQINQIEFVKEWNTTLFLLHVFLLVFYNLWTFSFSLSFVMGGLQLEERIEHIRATGRLYNLLIWER